MRKNIVVSILMFLSVAMSVPCSGFTLQDAVLAQNKPKRVNAIIPSTDGENYYELTKDKGKIVKKSYKSGSVVATVFDASTARDCEIVDWDGFYMSEDEGKILLYTNYHSIYRHSFKADYYIYEVRHNKLVKLSKDGAEEIASLSPDGRMVAYVKDNNVYVKKLDYDTQVAVTTDGVKNKIINGVPDWVYQEEFGLLSSLAWSPDNLTLSFIRWNETKVPMYGFPVYEGTCNRYPQYTLYPGQFDYKYPVAGADNSVVSVLSYDIENRVLKTMKLPIEADDYVPRIIFGKTSDRLMVTTLNRAQNMMQIFAVNPRSTIAKQIYSEKSDTWIDTEAIAKVRYYDDFFVVLSDKSGYSHLYQYSNSGALMKQLTSGNWNVTEYYGYDNIQKTHYMQTTQNGPLDRVVAKVDAKGAITVITIEKGTYSAAFNNNFTYYIQNYSNLKTPNQYVVCNNKGKDVRILELNDEYAAKYTASDVPVKEFFTMQSGGVTLNGYMIKPVNFDANKKYPVIMSQYSGPGSQEVLNVWKMDWSQYFATQGYIIACVDGRGTGGRGKAFESVVYKNLGKYESIDQLAAAQYMAKQPFVDASKIAIYGWSYGGYEALMAMSQADSKYAAGVAIAPVTDWRFYSSIYTERYMRTPKENEEGYEASAPINRVSDQKGRLLMMAGTADDNVHIANTLQYSAEMTEHNKLLDMMIYTNKNHSIYGCETRYALYLKVLDFFNSNLKNIK